MLYSDGFDGDAWGQRVDRFAWHATTFNRSWMNVSEKTPGTNFASEIHKLPVARRQLIFRVRRQIAEGTYDDEQKLEAALARMFDVEFDDAPSA